MSFTNTYWSTRPPRSNPCDACKEARDCDRICLIRARWWDVVMKKLKAGKDMNVPTSTEGVE